MEDALWFTYDFKVLCDADPPKERYKGPLSHPLAPVSTDISLSLEEMNLLPSLWVASCRLGGEPTAGCPTAGGLPQAPRR